jgi:hypothetical protein
MMTEQTHEKLKQIKQGFRLLMNGVASQSMREKGLQYKINWGIQLTELQKIAEEYGKDYDLAVELWKENIRECKILATMMMPPEKMPPELADLWMEQTPSQEIAEMTAFHLFQYLSYAPAMAYEWIASNRQLYQICGFQILSRLFMNGRKPDERGINELIDQSVAALSESPMAVKHAAHLCLLRFAELGEPYEQIVRNATKSINLDIL